MSHQPAGTRHVAELVKVDMDGGEAVAQIVRKLPRGWVLQYCGAQREVVVDSLVGARLAVHMPPPVEVDMSKVGQ